MRIKSVFIKNFRRLQSCKIDVGEKETIFVGANNSGKTTAMDALHIFLSQKEFHTQDFTLSNWDSLNTFGKEWEKEPIEDSEEFKNTLKIDSWDAFLPKLDLWIDVKTNEYHHVCHMIPTLDWTSGTLGIRLRLEPKDIQKLYLSYSADYKGARKNAGDTKVELYPKSLWAYLDRGNRLNEFFVIKYYILDPDKQDEVQPTPEDALDGDPLKGLIRIDTIKAQRGFSDANDKDTGIDNLSKQLQTYYKNHLSPEIEPTADDIKALSTVSEATKAFGSRLKTDFSTSLGEIENMNYPGFDNPSISIEPTISLIDGLNHQSAVRFAVDNTEGSELCLSEKYNGLGYQNLISMSYKLISFRDAWMRIGKKSKAITNESGADDSFEPLHLVLIEEPEAHLHVQVQQVFVKQAYSLLRNHNLLRDDNNQDKAQFSTQLIVSTHSSHIAHEVEFRNLRYFKREKKAGLKIPTTTVVNLSETFGEESVETKFITRYLKTTHCDIFFADAVILVEGAAERMFLPFFIKHNFPKLSLAYMSILEILGSHAHTLKPLVDKLGIITLIVTDLDTYKDGKVLPCKGSGQITNNDTIKKWVPCKTDIDILIQLPEKDKVVNDVRIAYQYEKEYIYREETDKQKEARVQLIPYTFEDALAFENASIIRDMDKSKGLLKKFVTALGEEKAETAAQKMFDALDSSSKKAEFAIELLYSGDVKNIIIPSYINDGLKWLEEKLANRG